MSRVRPGEGRRNIIFMPSKVRLNVFFEKIKNKGLKFIILLLNCILGPPNCTVELPNLGVGGSGPLDPLVYFIQKIKKICYILPI